MWKNKEIRRKADHILKGKWSSIFLKTILIYLLMIVIQAFYNAFIFMISGAVVGVFRNLFIQTLLLVLFFLIRQLPQLFIEMGFSWNFLDLTRGRKFDFKTFFAPFTNRPVRNFLVTLVKGIIVSLPALGGGLLLWLFGRPMLLSMFSLRAPFRGFGAFLIFSIIIAIGVFILSIWVEAIMAFVNFVLKDKLNKGTFDVIQTAFKTIKGHVLKYIGLQIVVGLQVLAGSVLIFAIGGLIGWLLSQASTWFVPVILFIAGIVWVLFLIAMMIRLHLIDAVFYESAAGERVID